MFNVQTMLLRGENDSKQSDEFQAKPEIPEILTKWKAPHGLPSAELKTF